MFNWNERPTRAKAKYQIGGDQPAVVYSIGQYEVTVPGQEVEVTYRVPHHHQTDPRSTFPDMEVVDGEIRIPVANLVDEVLSRVSPVELAQELWQDDDVKDAFISCLVNRYNGMNVGDAERRKFLAGVREAVHDKALDKLTEVMSKLEFEMCRRAHYFQEVRRINQKLRELDVKVHGHVKVGDEWVIEPVLLRFNELDRPTRNEEGNFTKGELEVTGQTWDEARTHWRNEVLKRFPNLD